MADSHGLVLGSWLIMVANKEAGLPLPDFVQEELNKANQDREAESLSMLEGLRMPRAS